MLRAVQLERSNACRMTVLFLSHLGVEVYRPGGADASASGVEGLLAACLHYGTGYPNGRHLTWGAYRDPVNGPLSP
jgi:hypothetical protein